MTLSRAVLSLGDSIAWGQGLLDSDKHVSLTLRHLAQKYPDAAFSLVIGAHSGAPIGFGKADAGTSADAEVPIDSPTIMNQAANAAVGAAMESDIRLILLNGGINDIGVNTLVDPRLSEADLRSKTELYCYTHMSELVAVCLKKFDQASIVITGYYQIISQASNPALIPIFGSSVGILLSAIPGAIVLGTLTLLTLTTISNNCLLFAQLANSCFNRIAAEANRRLKASGDTRRVAVAVPDYGPQNAVFAPQSYLWSVKLVPDPLDPVVPVDSAIPRRVIACHAARQAGLINDYPRCKFASIGHPNVTGAAAYAASIQLAIQQLVDDANWNPANCSWLPSTEIS